MARPTKINQEIIERICLAIRAGNYAKVAAAMAGISETTYYRWLEQSHDETQDPIYRELRESVKKAEADAEVASVALIRQAAQNGTWQAAAWYLERKHFDRWGRNDKIRQEVTGANGSPIQLSVDDAKAEVLRFLATGEETTE